MQCLYFLSLRELTIIGAYYKLAVLSSMLQPCLTDMLFTFIFYIGETVAFLSTWHFSNAIFITLLPYRGNLVI